MATYKVFRKSDGVEIFEYIAYVPIEWMFMEFATHDHMLQPEIAINQSSPMLGEITRREFRNRFNLEERIAIDKLRRNFETVPMPEETRDRIRTGFADYDAADPNIDMADPRVPLLMGIFVAFHCMYYERIQGVINGH